MNLAVETVSVEIPEGAEIPVGTISVIPHPAQWGVDDLVIPDFTILMSGQGLLREMYPQLQLLFSDTGGLYHFELPDLLRKFLMGWDGFGNPVFGSAVIYYETLPQKLLKPQYVPNYA